MAAAVAPSATAAGRIQRRPAFGLLPVLTVVFIVFRSSQFSAGAPSPGESHRYLPAEAPSVGKSRHLSQLGAGDIQPRAGRLSGFRQQEDDGFMHRKAPQRDIDEQALTIT